MSVIKSQAIDSSNIKINWNESYVSEAINRFMSSAPRGVYRGFTVSESATPGKSILVSVASGRDSFLLHEDVANGIKTAVRLDDSFTLEIPYTTSAVLQTLYIWVDVSYSTGTSAAAYLRVGLSGDRSTNSVTIAKIAIAASATTIIDSYITQDVTDGDSITSPVPDASINIWGMLNQASYNNLPSSDQKDALDGASSPSSSNVFVTESATTNKVLGEPITQIFSIPPNSTSNVQLTGWYYVGSGVLGTAAKWFSLFAATSTVESDEGLVRTDSHDEITLTVWNNTNTSQLNPSVDATDGFYQNPYLRYSPSIDASDYAVYAIQKSDFAGLDSEGLVRLPKGIQAPIHAKVMQWDYEHTRKRPASFTVSANSNDACDFNGATSLYTALQYLNTLNGGTIFVKKGDYTLTTTLTVTTPIKIYCEGSGSSSNERCQLTMSHSSGYGLTFSDKVEIYGLHVSASGKDAIKTSTNCVLENVSIVGDIYIAGGQYSLLRGVDVTGHLELVGNNALQIQFDSCTFANNGTSPNNAVYMQDTFQRVTFNNCYIGAGYLSGNSAGFQLDSDSTISKLEFNNTTFTCRGDYRAFEMDGGIGTLNQIQHIGINDCNVNILSGNTSEDASFYIKPSIGVSISIKGLFIKLGYTSGVLEAPMFEIEADNNDEYAYDINVQDLAVQGYAAITPIAFSGSSAKKAAIIATIADNGSGQGGSIRFNGIRANYFTGGPTGAYRCNLMELANAPSDTLLSVNGLHTSEHGGVTRMTALGYTNAQYNEIFVNTTGDGVIEIQDCVLDGSDLRASGTNTFRGIYLYSSGTCDARIYIRNCSILEYVENDIYVSIDDADVVLDGVKSVGHVMDLVGTRWSFNAAYSVQIVNCLYKCVSSGEPDCIDFLNSNVIYAVISNNIIHMCASTDHAIDIRECGGGEAGYSIIGNSGAGYITYASGSTILGVTGTLLNAGLTANPVSME